MSLVWVRAISFFSKGSEFCVAGWAMWDDPLGQKSLRSYLASRRRSYGVVMTGLWDTSQVSFFEREFFLAYVLL